jgi:hypothetical protein
MNPLENSSNNNDQSAQASSKPISTIETLATSAQHVESLTKPSEPPRQSALDRIEHTLYDPKKKQEDFVMHQSRDRVVKELPSSWVDNSEAVTATEEKEKMSFGVKLLIGSLVILFAALSFTAWRVLSSKNVVSSANIDLSLDIPPYVEGGESVPLFVKINNRNAVTLESSSITLMYKKGNGAEDEEEKVTEKKDLGALTSGTSSQEDFMVSLYGSEGESRDITVKFEYKVGGSNAVFSKLATVPVILKTPPMSVTIDGPGTLSAGQSGAFSFTVKNNTSTTSTSALLMLALPNIFVVENTSPKPIARQTVWTVPPLLPGEAHTVTLTGNLSGSQGEVSTMRAIVGSQGDSLADIGVVYSTETYDVKLRVSPLTLLVSLETERGQADSLRYGDVANLLLTYKNTSNQPIKAVTLLVAISGGAADIKGVQPDTGYYDSVKQIITWDPSTLPDGGSIQAGQEKSVRVRIPVALKGTNSPKLTLDVTGEGSLIETNDTVTHLSKSWAVQGSASINAETFYKNSPFQNTGPIPPVANQDTTYTAHLTLSAQNALTSTKITFSLPIYVTWRNVTSDNGTISYDPKSRIVTWMPGNVDAGKTITADIGLSVRPSQSQVNQSPAITSGIVLDATEEVSRATIRTTISPITTYIGKESWPTNPSRVVDR